MPHRIALALALLAGLLAAPAGAASVAEARVAASGDDAEESASGSVSLGSGDLELAYGDGSSQTVGMRFAGFAVPQGAEVHDAWVQFETDETGSTAVALTIHAQDADHAPTFTTSSRSLSSRPRVAGAVAWSPPAWTQTGVAGPGQRTPSLTTLVQAVVDRPGWASGNALVLLVTGSGTGKRTARSYNGEAAGAPLLHVEYSLPDVNEPPALSVLSPAHLTQLPADEAVSLVAEASDPEDGDLGQLVLWTSSRDGILGQGASASRELSVGLHTITATVEDSEGLAASSAADVQVTAEGHVLLAAGDIASCASAGDQATAALLDQSFGTVITLGDNVYPDGTSAEFQSCYEPSWGRHKGRTRPSAGNHEYHTTGAAGYFGYFGEAAGDPAKGWYSYDVGAWHVVVLNSNCSAIGGCTPSSPQGLWLQADLAAHPRDCTLATWHHPRWSSGDHGNIASMGGFWQLLYDAGADLVLNGHDHDYERFDPQNPAGQADPARGIREIVVGTGGASLRAFEPAEPNSVKRMSSAFGVLKLTLHDTSYDWDFLPVAGATASDSGSASCVVASGPANQAPSAAITAPANGASFLSGAPIGFSGNASDPEDGVLTNALSWTSDRDGTIGTGGFFTSSALSVGAHVIRASVQDSGGLPAVAEIALEVTQPTTLLFEKRIAASSDDAEEENAGAHDVARGSADLELTEDGRVQLVGLRFTALTIPKGARIVDAWLQFQADGSSSAATSLVIQTQASDDPPTFSATRRDISNRARGSAAVAWTPASWSAGAQGAAQRSPSLAGVVQQVVDRAGWVSGNDLVLIITGSGLRRAQSYDGLRAAAPLLHVEYEP